MCTIYRMASNKSKFSRDDRKQIVESIENLKNNEDYVAIFDILVKDTNNTYTHNSNGVFLNLSTVSDKTLSQIIKFLQKISKRDVSQTMSTQTITVNELTSKNDRAYKLSNYEKNILKHKGLKTPSTEKNYKELQFSEISKKSNLKLDKN